jgi:malonyl-CoA/methylmalonyl-CoA synthetase
MFLTYGDGASRVWNLANKGQILTNEPPKDNFINRANREFTSIKSFFNVYPSKDFIVNSIDKISRITDETEPRDFPTGNDDIAVICYTSGTTGRSKGAMITHRNLIVNMLDLKNIWRWTDKDILLHILPLFHVHGLFVALHGALNTGSTVIMHDHFDPGRVWHTLAEKKCTMMMGVPTIYQRLMNEWDKLKSKPDLSVMRVFISGSAPLSVNLFARFYKATGFKILPSTASIIPFL